MTHVCNLRSAWPVGHPLPVEDPAKLEGPVEGTQCVLAATKSHEARIVTVVQRSYVWSPGECRHNGGYRHYDWSVVTYPNGSRVCVNDSDLSDWEDPR